MKALKIIGGIFGTILVGVTVFYLGWLSPPSPDSVCDNVARIVKKEGGGDFSDKDRQACVAEAGKAPDFGRAVWVKKLKCMRDAQTSVELVACDKGGPSI
jgi:hypothetical protein